MIRVNYTREANSTFKVLICLGFFNILIFYLSVGEGVVLQVRVAILQLIQNQNHLIEKGGWRGYA